MAMMELRTHRYKGIFALVLIGVFFAGQALSCCVINHRLGQYLQSILMSSSMQESSCCPSHAASHEDNGANDHSSGKSCCIQDANQKHPQMPSEQISLPQTIDFVESVLPAFPRILAKPLAYQEHRSSSDPPAYLTHLQFLI